MSFPTSDRSDLSIHSRGTLLPSPEDVLLEAGPNVGVRPAGMAKLLIQWDVGNAKSLKKLFT